MATRKIIRDYKRVPPKKRLEWIQEAIYLAYMKKTKGGYQFHRSDEQIARFMKVPALDKLRWLDSCRQLIFSIEDKNFHKIRQKFRRGEI